MRGDLVFNSMAIFSIAIAGPFIAEISVLARSSTLPKLGTILWVGPDLDSLQTRVSEPGCGREHPRSAKPRRWDASTLAMDGAASEWCKTRRLPPSLPKLNERPTGAASLLTAGLLMVVLWARKETPGLDSGKC